MNPRRKQVLAVRPVWLAGALLCLSCGCSTFNCEWREAGRQSAPTNSLEGRWEGRWLSEVNGHTGKLRCLLSRRPDGNYAARFRATYWHVLGFSYTVTLKVERLEDDWHFRGEENLGKLAGGVYHYAGRATAADFHSTYDSKYDRGTFEMYRPVGDPNPVR